jgi:hypothetical protein
LRSKAKFSKGAAGNVANRGARPQLTAPRFRRFVLLRRGMGFTDTYREHVIACRRDRARRAIFISRVLGIMLMVTLGFALRSEPQLRSALLSAAMDVMEKSRGAVAASEGGSASWSAVSTAEPDRSVSVATGPTGLRDRVKVNRHFNAEPEAAQPEM